MQVSRIRALRGPNLWTRHTAVEAVVTCTEKECSLEHLPGFEEQLSRLFPAMGALPDIHPVAIQRHIAAHDSLAIRLKNGSILLIDAMGAVGKISEAFFPPAQRATATRHLTTHNKQQHVRRGHIGT